MSDMKQFIFLSHTISEETPGFGGHKVFFGSPKKSISKGDSCNQQMWEMDNHGGTHIDLPKHFFENGKAIDAYEPHEFVFHSVGLLDLSLKPTELIEIDHFKTVDLPSQMELLLIRTDFEARRGKRSYWEENPGVSPEVASHLRSAYPHLRAIGFDFISLTSFQHRPVGRLAHQEFLGTERPIWIIEDMSLKALAHAPDQVIVSPLRVSGADGAPCTILAKV